MASTSFTFAAGACSSGQKSGTVLQSYQPTLRTPAKFPARIVARVRRKHASIARSMKIHTPDPLTSTSGRSPVYTKRGTRQKSSERRSSSNDSSTIPAREPSGFNLTDGFPGQGNTTQESRFDGVGIILLQGDPPSRDPDNGLGTVPIVGSQEPTTVPTLAYTYLVEENESAAAKNFSGTPSAEELEWNGAVSSTPITSKPAIPSGVFPSTIGGGEKAGAISKSKKSSREWESALAAALKTKFKAREAEPDPLSGSNRTVFERLELKPAPEDAAQGEGSSEALQIVKSLENKHILITGVTGFLAKVLLEKILRIQPLIGQLYLLIRAGNYSTIEDRLASAVFGSSLFKPLRGEYGDEKFLDFIVDKVTPVYGDIAKPGLNLGTADAQMLMRSLHVIISSAATTKFDERYDKAVEVNTLGPLRLLAFAKQCRGLSLFQHISTAYVNGKRKGVCRELPFEYGQSLLTEIHQGGASQEPPPRFDPESEVELAFKTRDDLKRKYGSDEVNPHPDIAKEMVKLGSERAQMFGWSDTYTLTKAMGEQMLKKHKGDVPVVIIRPSVVESTVRLPFDGWIEGQRMLDPIVSAYGKGYLKGFLVDPDTVLDVIPADIVVNVTLAAMVKHGGYKQRNLVVYQVASSAMNPLTMRNVADACYDHFRKYPMVSKKDSLGSVKEIKVNHCVFIKSETVFWFLVNLLFDLPLKVLNSPFLVKDKRFSKTRISLKFNYENIKNLAETYKPYVFYEGRFDATNSDKLLSQLWDEEKDSFGYSVKDVDWYTYLNKSHLPGLRQHVLGWKQTGTVDPDWTVIDSLPERQLPPSERKLRLPSRGLYQLPVRKD